MKRPLIEYDYRMIHRLVPNSFTADRVNLAIATAHLKREIDRSIRKLLDKILKK